MGELRTSSSVEDDCLESWVGRWAPGHDDLLAEGVLGLERARAFAKLHGRVLVRWPRTLVGNAAQGVKGVLESPRGMPLVTLSPSRQIDQQLYALALPTGSNLRDEVNEAILRLTESPEWRLIQRAYLGGAP